MLQRFLRSQWGRKIAVSSCSSDGLVGLDTVPPGRRARVEECVGDGAVGSGAVGSGAVGSGAVGSRAVGNGVVLQRLCEMGFVPGVSVRVVRYAPLGDPMEVELYGSHVSLRKSEAALLRVRLQDPSWNVAPSEEPDRAAAEGVSKGSVGALEPACPTS